MAGVTKSGQYWIDPDGPTGQIPAELRVCEFAPNSLTRIPGDPTTIIGTGVASKIRRLRDSLYLIKIQVISSKYKLSKS